MASVNTSGIDDIENKLKRIPEQMRGNALKQILLAGAERAEQIWKDTIQGGYGSKRHVSAENRHHVHMYETVGHTEPVLTLSGGTTQVYPLGQDHGVRHAARAYMVNYKVDPFVDKIIDKVCDNECPKVMQDKLNEILERMDA